MNKQKKQSKYNEGDVLIMFKGKLQPFPICNEGKIYNIIKALVDPALSTKTCNCHCHLGVSCFQAEEGLHCQHCQPAKECLCKCICHYKPVTMEAGQVIPIPFSPSELLMSCEHCSQQESLCDCYCHYTPQVLTTPKGATLRKECPHCSQQECKSYTEDGHYYINGRSVTEEEYYGSPSTNEAVYKTSKDGVWLQRKPSTNEDMSKDTAFDNRYAEKTEKIQHEEYCSCIFPNGKTPNICKIHNNWEEELEEHYKHGRNDLGTMKSFIRNLLIERTLSDKGYITAIEATKAQARKEMLERGRSYEATNFNTQALSNFLDELEKEMEVEK